MFSKLREKRHTFQERERYATRRRAPFYALAGEYLPPEHDAIVVDIGCGYADFATQLNLFERYPNLALLDGNQTTVEKLERARLYRVPDKLPFSDGSVAYIHCSHLIEHLYYDELYRFLHEIDRALAPGGILVVSAPLLWKRFFHNLTHVSPYGPEAFINYLARGNRDEHATADPAAGVISYSYCVERLVYRYRREPLFSEVGARFFLLDFCIWGIGRLLQVLGIQRYVQNGYTLVLRKA